jgi:nicotinamide-nucleotide amidase
MNAEILAVGTELLLGQIVDTHSATMARILAECGINCNRRATVGDNLDRIVAMLQEMLERADVVVTIGGLGPTQDDLTRDAIAIALGDELVHEPEVERKLRKFFAARNVPWMDSIARQAQRPASATLIDNPNGTAPGLHCQKNGKTVIALPGPKGEFVPLANGSVRGILSKLQGGEVIHSRILRVCGLGESEVEARVLDLMEGKNPTVAPYAHPGEVHLRLTARASSEEEADKLIDPVEAQIRAILGDNLFGVDDTTLEKATIDLAVAKHATIAVAESMTGGGLGERLTSVTGASAAFLGGLITYNSRVKSALLDVSSETLDRFGPVSSEIASGMAQGVRAKTGATFGVSITGNAGPASDVDDKPVGLVFIAIAGPAGTQVEEVKYRGTREDIRRRASQYALVQLRLALLRIE